VIICTSYQISRRQSSKIGLELSQEGLREKFVKRYIDKKTFKNSGVGGDSTKANSNTIFVSLQFVATQLLQRREL
jgi:hypothetical protein